MSSGRTVTAAVDVAVTDAASCSLGADGTVTCWGAGSATPVLVTGISNARSIVAADDRFCAENGESLACWRSGETLATPIQLHGAGR